MGQFLSRLPDHERRRLEAVPGEDPEALARRRLQGVPLQYLEGSAPFADFEVAVDQRVLVPRPETEGLYDLVRRLAGEPESIVDLGTGSGVLAIALARAFPAAEVHATDSAPAAVAVARANTARLAPGVVVLAGDLFGPLPGRLAGRVDVLVSNPPYVAKHEWHRLPADVRHEPREALVAGPRGLEVLERIAEEAGHWVAPRGLVAVEMGETQAAAVVEAFSALGEPRVHLDLAGRPRYVVVKR